MGIRRCPRRGLSLLAVLLARVPYRSYRSRPVRAISRRRSYRCHWTHGVHAHGRVARSDPDYRADLAVHVLWPFQPGDLAVGDRHSHQHRPTSRKRARGGAKGTAGGTTVRRYGGRGVRGEGEAGSAGGSWTSKNGTPASSETVTPEASGTVPSLDS